MLFSHVELAAKFFYPKSEQLPMGQDVAHNSNTYYDSPASFCKEDRILTQTN
jgi:hypothetical protein